MASTNTLQIAYKDKSGNVRYQQVSTASGLITRAYNSASSSTIKYNIKTTSENIEY